MNEAEFDRLIKGYLNNSLSARERELVDKWIESMSTRDTPIEWSDEERARLKTKLMQQISSREAGQINIVGYVRKNRRSAWLRAAAAILLPALLISYFAWEWSGPVADNGTADGAYKKEILPDGTIAWLKGENAELSFEFAGQERIMHLEGEALMEVAKDPEHPFVIQCRNGATTRVLGTSFNIKASDEKVEVSVLTGRVALSSADKQQRMEILPKEKAIYNASQGQIVRMELGEQERIALIGGTAYNMRFPDTKMREIIPRIEDKFNVTVQVGNANLRNCRVTADFTDQSLERTLDMISQILDIEYKIRKDGIVTLQGAGCE